MKGIVCRRYAQGYCVGYKTSKVDTKRRGRTISSHKIKASRRLTKRNGNKVTKDSVFVFFAQMTIFKAKSPMLILELPTKQDRRDDRRACQEGGKQEKVRASKKVVDIELWYLSDLKEQSQCVGRGIRGKSKKKGVAVRNELWN